MLSKKATTLGYGNKSEIIPSNNPGPGTYNPINKENVGCKIALGREVILFSLKNLIVFYLFLKEHK